MSGIGSFLNAFAATTMESQKRKQEQMQFMASLAIQQAALQQQAMNQQRESQQFQQQMALREQERKDQLAQNKVQNQLGAFRAQTEAANTQSLEKSRIEGLAEKKRASEAALEQKYAAARNDKTMADLLEKRAAWKAQKLETGSIDQAISSRATDLGLPPEELQKLLGDGQQPAPGQPQTAQAVPGATPAGPLTGEPPAQPGAPQGQTTGQGGIPNLAQQAGAAAQARQQGQAPVQPAMAAAAQALAERQAQGAAPAQAAASSGPMGLGAAASRYQLPAAQPKGQDQPAGFQEKEFETQAEAERQAGQFKKYDMPFFATSKEGKIKADREEKENLLKAYQAEASFAETQKAEMEDAFRQAGADVQIRVSQPGTEMSSLRGGGHFGGFMGSGISFGTTKGESHKTLAKVDLFPVAKHDAGFWTTYGANEPITPGSETSEDKSLATTLKLGQVLYDKAVTRGEKVSQIWVAGVQDVMRDRIDSELGNYGKQKTIDVGSFSSTLDPKLHEAAKAAVGLAKEDQQLAEVSKTNNLPYVGTGVPQVVDRPETPVDMLHNFEKTFGKIGKPLPNMDPNRAELGVISELQTRMQSVTLDEAGKKEATRIRDKMMRDPNLSDQFKARADQVFKAATAAPTPKAGKPTAESAGGMGGMRGMATLAALGGLSDFGAQKTKAEQKPAQKPLPQNKQAEKPAQTVNAALGSIKASKNREQAAKDAVSKITSTYGSLSKEEKDNLRKTWQTTKGTWKALGVSDEQIARAEKLINPK